MSKDGLETHRFIDGIPAINRFCEALSPATLVEDDLARSKAAAEATEEFVTIAKSIAQLKPQERDTVRREIDRIARQLEGLTKSLKRVKETV